MLDVDQKWGTHLLKERDMKPTVTVGRVPPFSSSQTTIPYASCVYLYLNLEQHYDAAN